MTSICFSISGSETSPILLKFSPFSAQISGFSADFHRKSLDIVKQHSNNGLIACFSLVIKVELVNIGVPVRKNWELENGKKSGFWRSKK